MSRNKEGVKIVAISCFILLLWIGCASAATLIVSKTSPACTSGDEYFTSIQAAVDRAEDGDEIVVCPGTYVENIKVDKSITIRSENGSDSTVVQAENPYDHVLKVIADYVSISGFTVEGATGGFSGISLYYVDYCNISNNNCSNNKYGFYLYNSNNNSISNNNCSLNSDDGIGLDNSNNNSISNNNASNNMQTGIVLSESNNNIIRDNTAKSNKQYHGISFSSSNNNLIEYNNASDNMMCGIRLWKSNNNAVKGNIANSNKHYHGISLTSSNNNDIVNNTASSNMQCGIPLWYSSNNNTIRGNTATLNKQSSGIALMYTSNNNHLINNKLLYNCVRGVRVFERSNNNIISKNIIYSNTKPGIRVEISQNNTILDNIINANFGAGIIFASSENNTILNNIISSNHAKGLGFQKSGNNNILNNFIDSNDEKGIDLSFNSSYVIMSGNTFYSNFCDGVYIGGDSTSCKIHHNNIINNKVQGGSLNNNNSWYDASLKEGNFWSGYDGVDIDGDGIGDTNKGYDLYPFMNRDGWLTMSVWPHYLDFGKVYQGTEIKNHTFTITNYGNSILNVSSIKYDNTTIEISGIVPPVLIAKGSSRSFTITLDTETLEGFVLKNIEIISNDIESPHKNISIFGFVEIPTPNINIKEIDFPSRGIIKGQTSLFNITIENLGYFREKNVTVEIKEGKKILDNTIIENIEPEEAKSAIVKWNTENASLRIHEIKIEVLSKDKESLTKITVKVSVLAPSKAKTLIVTNLERLKGVENKLIELSHHPSVNGIILNVENDARCSEAYKSWDSNLTTENANDVAKAIKDLIDSTLDVYKNIEYIIIVGNDEVIPFYRIQDKSLESYVGSYGLYDEKDYIEKYKQLKPATTIGVAFNETRFLTDDFYANFESEELPEGFEGELYIPEKPIGRLVETPAEINKTIAIFSNKGDIVNPKRIFITSYDFMNDSGGSCASVWSTLRTPVFMGKGIEKPGTYNNISDIINELRNESNNIVAIFQHADHCGFDIEESHDCITSDIIASSSKADLNGSIVYSMSCHAGLNVPEDEKYNYDLAQAFMSKGVLTYVAPTGWGIGGVVTEAGHEKIMHYFTKHLCDGMDTGTALMLAKQDYYAFDFDFDYIDQKVVSTAVLYGLPMYGVNIEGKEIEGKADDSEKAIKAMSMEKPYNTFTFRPDYSEIVETPVGNYSSVDETLSSPGKPVLPKLIWPYMMDKKMLHGITLRNASYDVIENTTMPYEEIVVSIAGVAEQRESTDENWNTSEFFKVSTIGKKQYIILITGQFKKAGWIEKDNNMINGGTLRRYTELTFDLYFSSLTDEKEPPKINVSQINSTFIKVNVTDESGIRKIVVAYTDNKGKWGSFDIEPDTAACALELEIELEEEKEYFVQAVDIYGNVAVDDNEGEYYPEKGGELGPS